MREWVVFTRCCRFYVAKHTSRETSLTRTNGGRCRWNHAGGPSYFTLGGFQTFQTFPRTIWDTVETHFETLLRHCWDIVKTIVMRCSDGDGFLLLMRQQFSNWNNKNTFFFILRLRVVLAFFGLFTCETWCLHEIFNVAKQSAHPPAISPTKIHTFFSRVLIIHTGWFFLMTDL